MRRLALALLALLLWAGCGARETTAKVAVPERAATGAEALLAVAPLGADVLVEVDLRRLRNNPVVGDLLAALGKPGVRDESDLLARARSMLVCVYRVGESPKQLILLEAESDREFAEAAAIGAGRFAVGEPEYVARAVALGGGEGQSMLEDTAMLRLRATVMPEKAEAAAVRAVATLDFDARVLVASTVGMSAVPVSIAVWGDVVDDLALVAHVVGDEENSPQRLLAAMDGLRLRIAKQPLVRHLGLSRPLANASLVRSGAVVRVVFVLAPKRLLLVAKRLKAQIEALAAPSSESEQSLEDSTLEELSNVDQP